MSVCEHVRTDAVELVEVLEGRADGLHGPAHRLLLRQQPLACRIQGRRLAPHLPGE